MTKLTKNDYDLVARIVDRAEKDGQLCDKRINHMMDVTVATKQFNIKLQEWLEADDENFYHDFFGIYVHIDRPSCKVVDFFVPRFAGLH